MLKWKRQNRVFKDKCKNRLDRITIEMTTWDMIKVMMVETTEMRITDLLIFLVILNSILLYF